MSKILLINSSPMADNSISRKLTASFVAKYQAAKGETFEVIEHDTVALNLPHADGDVLGAYFTPADQRSAEQQAHVDRSDTIIKAIKEADAIVLGVPMHNFGIPSGLKAYVDHFARAGETFKYTENGPVGLVEDKPVYVLATRGGDYSENGYPQLDFVLPYLKTVFGFIGLNDVTALQANGLAMGEEAVAAAIAKVEEEIDQVLAA